MGLMIVKRKIFARAVLVVCLFGLLTFYARSTFACSCGPTEDPIRTMERADAVFSGKVIDIDHQQGLFATKRSSPYILFPWDLRRTEATVIVSKVWKGEVYSETIVMAGGRVVTISSRAKNISSMDRVVYLTSAPVCVVAQRLSREPRKI
jgi:hypothetical protein